MLREDYTPRDLFEEVRSGLTLKGGTVSVDDSVLDKPYGQLMAFVGYFWSGKHHGVVKGIKSDDVVLHRSARSPSTDQLPNLRQNREQDQNDYFQEMLVEVLAWGLQPAWVTGDSWYSSTANLKMIKTIIGDFCLHWKATVGFRGKKANGSRYNNWRFPKTARSCTSGIRYGQSVSDAVENQPRHYALYQPNDEDWVAFDRPAFLKLHDQHWQIEQYHRTLKQVCHIEYFQVRQPTAIRNHLFAAICGYVQLQRLQATDVIRNCYRLQRELFNEVIAAFIKAFAPNLGHLNPHFQPPVNA